MIATTMESRSLTMTRPKGRKKLRDAPRERDTAADQQVTWTLDGWCVRYTPYHGDAETEPLTAARRLGRPGQVGAHRTRAPGPARSVHRAGERNGRHGRGRPGLAGRRAPQEWNFQTTETIDGIFNREIRRAWPAGSLPEAKVLAAWLGQVGHESAIDEAKNLRLTLKSRGCDGQVRPSQLAKRAACGW